MTVKLRYFFGFLALACSVVVTKAPACDLPAFKESTSAAEIIESLNKVVVFAEGKIVQMTKKKEELEKDMVDNEKQSVALNQEKIGKKRQSNELKTKSEELRVSIGKNTKTKKEWESKLQTTHQQIGNAQRGIDAANRKISNIQGGINQKNAEIAHLNHKIDKENRKRRCGLGKKKRRRRSAKPRAWRRFRVRVRVPRIRIRVPRVVRNVGRVVKDVVTVVNPVVCIVNNIVSRLKRTKEKAERDKRNLMNALTRAHQEKGRWNGEKNRLVLAKTSYETKVKDINNQLTSLTAKLASTTKLKATTDERIRVLTSSINEITSKLKKVDTELKDIRERKSKVLQIIQTLKKIHHQRLEDMKELKDADADERADILEDIKQINEAIRKSVNELRMLVCK